MAYCEACGATGLNRKEMRVDTKAKLMVCITCFEKDDIKLGVEMSSKAGVKAYLTYNGFSIEYKKDWDKLPAEVAREEIKPAAKEEGFPEGMPVGEA